MKRNFFCTTASVIALCLLLTHCATPKLSDGAPGHFVDVSQIPNATPRPLAKSRYGNPSSYVVNGRRYTVLKSSRGYNRTGIASWYGTKFHGRLTSTREPYNMYAMTAASPNLPIPCFARVTNLQNHRQVIVKINDRGPFAANRIIDLSWAAAVKLGVIKTGTAPVRVTTIETPSSNKAPQYSAYASIHRPVAKPFVHQHHWYLQVGSFRNQESASALLQRTQVLTNQPGRIKSTAKLMGSLYQVQIGPVYNIDQSNQLLQKLRQAGYHHVFTASP